MPLARQPDKKLAREEKTRERLPEEKEKEEERKEGVKGRETSTYTLRTLPR